MVDWFLNLNPVIQALLATLFTWFVTALGASNDQNEAAIMTPAANPNIKSNIF